MYHPKSVLSMRPGRTAIRNDPRSAAYELPVALLTSMNTGKTASPPMTTGAIAAYW